MSLALARARTSYLSVRPSVSTTGIGCNSAVKMARKNALIAKIRKGATNRLRVK